MFVVWRVSTEAPAVAAYVGMCVRRTLNGRANGGVGGMLVPARRYGKWAQVSHGRLVDTEWGMARRGVSGTEVFSIELVFLHAFVERSSRYAEGLSRYADLAVVFTQHGLDDGALGAFQFVAEPT